MNFTSFRRVCSLFVVCFTLMGLVGCGGGDKVSGTVEFEDGTKLTHGTVTFVSSEVEEQATINEDGTYKLENGLPAGDYEVFVVSVKESEGDDGAGGDGKGDDGEVPDYGGGSEDLVHADYAAAGKTPLKYTSPGESEFNIKVKKP